jgi:hypothetical protein
MSSICIPRIESTVQKDFIYKTFANLKLGTIEKIIDIPLRNDPTHKRVIIKIHWNTANQKAIIMREFLSTKGSAKLVYDMPWYWKIVPTHPQI